MTQIFDRNPQRKLLFAFLGLLISAVSLCNAQDVVPMAITPQNSTGDLPYSTSIGSATEHVELATGNLRINIPIVSVPGRKLSFDFGLQYDARYWTIGQVSTENALFSYWKPELRNWITSNSLGWTTTEGFLTFGSAPRSCIVGTSTDGVAGSDEFDSPSTCDDDGDPNSAADAASGANCAEQEDLEDDDGSSGGGGGVSLFGAGGGINSDSFLFTDRHGMKHALGINITTSGEACSVGSYDVSNYSGPSRAMDGFWAASLFGGITIYGPDGLVMPAGSGQQLGSGILNENTFFSDVLSETDAHGNSQGVGAGVTDSMGRQPVTMTSSSNQVIYTTESSNGAPQQYTVGLTNLPISTFFNVQGPDPVAEDVETRQVIQSVMLPNGQQYTFQYNDVDAQGHQYGYITHIGLPTGGSVDYTWVNVLPCASGILMRSVQSRIVNDNSGSHEWDFSYSPNCFMGSLQSSTTTVLAPPDVNGVRARTVYTYDGTNDLVNIQYGTNSSPQILKAFTLAYDISAGLDGATDAPQLISIQTTLPSGSTGATISNLRTFEYDKFMYERFEDGICGSGADAQELTCESEGASEELQPGPQAISHGNVTAIHDYDWAPTGTQGALLKQTIRTYLTDTNPGYFQTGQNLPYPATTSQWVQLGPVKSITDKVASETTYDGSVLCHGTAPLNSTGIIAPPPGCTANKIAQTTYTYDTGAPQSYGFFGDLTSATKWLNTGSNVDLSYNYDAYGNLIALHDGNNNPPTVIGYADSFSTSGTNNCGVSTPTNAYPTTVTNALGQQAKITYSPCTGSKTNIKDPNDIASGASGTGMSYDEMGRLILTTYSDGGQTQTTYNDAANTVETQKLLSGTSNWLTTFTILDELGRTVQTQLTSDPQGTDYTDTTYDALGRVDSVSNPYRSTSDPTYGITSYLYDALDRKTFQCQPDNGAANSATCVPSNSAQSWAYNGNTATFTDEANRSWQRTSDALGRITNVVEPNGATTSYAYDALNNLLAVNQNGASGETPRTRSFTYDSLSRLLTSTNPETGTICYGLMSAGACQNGYDANGNLLAKTDARGVTTNYSYDVLNRLTSKTYSGVTGAVAATPPSTFVYDASPNGVAVLNPIGRLVEEYTGPSSAPNTERFILKYDAMGRITQEQQCSALSVCGTAPYNFQYIYDLAGNMISSTNGVSNIGIGLTYGYDGAGRLQTVTSTWDDATHPATLFSPPASGAQYSPVGLSAASLGTFSSTQSPVYALQRAYDNRLRPVSEADVATASQLNPPTASTGSIVMAGAVQQTNGAGTHATGTVTITGTEGSHQVCSTGPVPEPVEGQPLPKPITRCTNVFDTGALSVTVNGFTATASYTALSTDQTIVTALANALNATGSPVSAAASSNVLTMTSIATGTSANYPFSLSNGVDFSGTDSGAALSGGVVGPVIDDSGSVSLTVNGSTSTVPWQEGSTAQSIATSLASALQSADGNFLTVSLSGATLLLASKQTGAATNMAVTTSVAYNNTSFKSASFSATASGMTGGANSVLGPTTIYSYSIPAGGYAPNNNLLTVNDLVTGGWAYTYDSLNRLIAAQASANAQTGFAPYGSGLLNWTYDSFGNNKGETLSGSTSLSLPQVTHTYTGNSLLNGVARNGVVTNQMDGYNYDASGNLLSDNISSSYSYNAEGRVASVDGTTQYVYDAEGLRVAKLNGTTPTNLYLLGLGGEQVSEINNSTGTMAWAHSNVYAAGKLLATYNPGGLHYQFSDWLGTRRVQSLVQASGAETVEETCQSLPYGDALTCSGTDATEQHFTGKERDSESGLDYFGARYYASSMGRYMSPDWSAKQEPVPYSKLDNPQTLNLYSYVQNNPLSNFDDDGHATIEVKYNPLALGSNHSFIVITDRDGTQTVFRAGPSVSAGTGWITPATGGSASQSATPTSSQSDSSNSSSPGAGTTAQGNPYGQLVSQQESPTDPNGDNMSTISGSTTVLSNDLPASSYITGLQQFDTGLNQANIPYNPLSTNSNAYVTNALQSIGVPTPKAPVWAPGAGTNLHVTPAPPAPPPPGPPPCSVAGACSTK